MKNLVRFAVAGALMAGFATAQAQAPLPASGSADLWLFVSDAAAGSANNVTGETFAEDTGIPLSSILPSSGLVTNATALTTALPANFSLTASAALTTFINAANSAGQTLDWGVLGGQYPGGTGNAKDAAGDIISVASNPVAQAANMSQLTYTNLKDIVLPLNSDVTYLNQTYVAGGTTYLWGNGSAGGQVWGAATGSAGGSTDLYGQGPDQSGITLGSSTGLYGLTGNGSTGILQTYTLGTNGALLSLSDSGTLSIASNPVVTPLPAAVWLFGSGLLGLLGVGRRRAATQA